MLTMLVVLVTSIASILKRQYRSSCLCAFPQIAVLKNLGISQRLKTIRNAF